MLFAYCSNAVKGRLDGKNRWKDHLKQDSVMTDSMSRLIRGNPSRRLAAVISNQHCLAAVSMSNHRRNVMKQCADLPDLVIRLNNIKQRTVSI